MISAQEADRIARATWDAWGLGSEAKLKRIEIDGGWRYRGVGAVSEMMGATDVVVRASDGRVFRVPVGATPAVVAAILTPDV